jgi:hypothetical protein
VPEVRATAKSVSKWTWQHFSDENFSRIQQARANRRWSQLRTPSLEQEKPWESMRISRRTYYSRKKSGLLLPVTAQMVDL